MNKRKKLKNLLKENYEVALDINFDGFTRYFESYNKLLKYLIYLIKKFDNKNILKDFDFYLYNKKDFTYKKILLTDIF